MLLASDCELNGRIPPMFPWLRVLSRLLSDTRHNTSTWACAEEYSVLVFNKYWILERTRSFHLVYLQQHISPGSFAQRLIVNTAVVQTMFFLIWLQQIQHVKVCCVWVKERDHEWDQNGFFIVSTETSLKHLLLYPNAPNIDLDDMQFNLHGEGQDQTAVCAWISVPAESTSV